MLEPALIAFATFFATVGPPDVAIAFAALTPKASAAARYSSGAEMVSSGAARPGARSSSLAAFCCFLPCSGNPC